MSVLWISEAAVVERLTLPRAIDAVERALAREAVGAARTMLKTHLAWGDGHTLHAIGGLGDPEHAHDRGSTGEGTGGARPSAFTNVECSR